MWTDYFRLAFKTFTSEKKRTLLTLIGIFIGIAAVVSLISLGQGLQAGIRGQFDVLGTNKIFVTPGSRGAFNPANTIKLSQKDVDAMRAVSGVKAVSAMIYKIAGVEYSGERKYTFVIGIDDSEESFEKVMEAFGVTINQGRGARGTREAVIPYRFVIGDFYKKPVRVGDRLKIEGKKFRATGAVSQVGNPQDDTNLYITMDSAKELFNVGDDEIDYVMITVKDGEKPATVAEQIKKRLRKTRNVKEGNEDFTVQTTEDFMKTFNTILLIVQIVLIGIAAISLLVGGVNIANTMYTAVMERTKEIGIMKAIGAKNSDIFMIFLIESGMLGVVGGILGLGAGAGLSKLVSYGARKTGWAMVQSLFPWYLTIGAILFSFVVGAIAGTLPARQASKLKPVDALRYE